MVKKRKEDFSNYMSNILQNSMLTGIPQIASAGNWPKKITRSLVFIMCVVGFVYQSLTFMWLYWEYKTVVDVQVFNPTYVEKPAVTVCNVVGIKSKEFCEDPESEEIRQRESLECSKIENSEDYNWCDCIPRFCNIEGELMNLTYLVDGYEKLLKYPRKELKKWLLTRYDIETGYDEYKTQDEVGGSVSGPGEAIDVQCPYGTKYPEYCLSFNSLHGKPDRVYPQVGADAETRYWFQFTELNVPSTEKEARMYVSIHNRHTIVNPFTEGYVLERAMYYNFHLRRVIKNLLPAPYETDCMDYLETWKANGGRGPTNMKECIQECQKNISLERYGCLVNYVYTPGDYLRCLDIKDDTIFEEARKLSVERCKPACYEEYYIMSEDVSYRDEIYCFKNKYKFRSEYSYVAVHYDGMETTRYSYSPKYEKIETFSYLGGYVGMWLGISLVAVFDFLETVFVMMKYPLRRFTAYREKRRRHELIRKAHRNL